MGVILVVAAEDASADVLRAALSATDVEVVASTGEAVSRVSREAAKVDAVVLGPGVSAPIQASQRLHAADPDLGVLMVCDVDAYPRVSRAALLAPLLGDVRCAPLAELAPRAALARELHETREGTRARRAHRRTIATLNERLTASLSEPSPPRADDYVGQLLEHAPIGVVVLDALGRVVAGNPQAEILTGLSERRMLGAPLAPLFTEEDRPRWEAFHGAVLRPGGPLRETFRLRGAAALVDVQITLAGVSGRDGAAGTLALLEDVTAREQARLEREEALEAAEEASRFKDEFLAVVSHELRTPLTAILGWAQALSLAPRPPELLARGLASIARNAAAQARIVEDLLDVSRIIAGKLGLQLDRVDLGLIARQALEVVSAGATAKSVAIDLSTAAEVLVLGDAGRLQQVVWNLLGNAVKFTPAGGRIDLHVGGDERCAELVVRDTGAGISPDFLPHVFERFRQADASTTRVHGGLGLGLAIVQHIVELHGGAVRVESGGPGRGATFTVTLPRLRDALAIGPPPPPDGVDP